MNLRDYVDDVGRGLTVLTDKASGYIFGYDNKVVEEEPKNDYLMEYRDDISKDEGVKRKKPVIRKEYIIPKTNQQSSSKLYTNSYMLTSYMKLDDFELLGTDSYQKPFMREEPKLLWQTEKLEDIGDCVLLFPNPDYPEIEIDIKNSITFDEGMRYFKKIFNSEARFEGKKQFMTAVKKAFEDAFLQLEEYIEPTDEDLEEFEKEKLTKMKELKKLRKRRSTAKKSAGKNDILIQKESLDPNIAISKRKYSADGSSIDSKRRESVVLSDNMTLRAHTVDSQAKTLKKSATKTNPPGYPESSKGNEVDIEAEKRKSRIVWGGGLFIKPVIKKSENEEEAKKNRDKDLHYWTRTAGETTKDFLTLIRKTVCVFLAHHGFIIREIFVDEGKKIALVLTIPEVNIKRIAEEMEMPKRVNFAQVDLMSLEPVDSKYRPLRLNIYLLDKQKWEKQYELSSNSAESNAEISALRETIVSLLSGDCDFKRITRLVNGDWHEGFLDPSNIYDHDIIQLDVWRAYKEYLLNLAVRIKQIEINIEKIKVLYTHFYNQIETKYKRDEEGVQYPYLSFHQRQIVTHQGMDRRRFDKIEVGKYACAEVVRAFLESKEALNQIYLEGMKRNPQVDHKQLKPILKNVWDIMKSSELEYSFNFKPSTNKMKPKNRVYYEMLWKDYNVCYSKPANREKSQRRIKTRTVLKENENQSPNENNPLLQENKEHAKAKFYRDRDEDGSSNQDKIFYYYQFTKLERIKAVEYLVNKLIDLSRLESLFSSAEAMLQSALNLRRIKILKFFSFMDDENIFFPLHIRKWTDGFKEYSSLFDNLKKDKLYYDMMLADKSVISCVVEQIMPDDTRSFVSKQESKVEHYSGIFGGCGQVDLRQDKATEVVVVEKMEKSALSKSSKKKPKSASKSKIGRASAHKKTINLHEHTKFDKYISVLKREMDFIDEEMSFSYEPLRHVMRKIQGMPFQTLATFKDDQSSVHFLFDREILQKSKSIVGGSIKIEEEMLVRSPIYKATIVRDKRKEKEKLKEICAKALSDYRMDSSLLAEKGWAALKSGQPLRNYLPTVYTNSQLVHFNPEEENENHFPLATVTKMTFFNNLKQYPVHSFKVYFGEKIALYFSFLAFYRDKLIGPVIYGIALAIILIIYRSGDDPEAFKERWTWRWLVQKGFVFFTIIFAFYITLWSNRFKLSWIKYEESFGLRYGQNSVEEEKVIRVNYRGIKGRNIITDDINDKLEDKKLKKFRYRITQLFVIAFGILTLLCSYWLINAKRNHYRNIGSKSESMFSGPLVLFNFLEFLRLTLFQRIFFGCITKLIRWQNCKYAQDHEGQLVLDLGMYQLFNNSVAILIISLQTLLTESIQYEIYDSNTNTYRIVEGSATCIAYSCSIELNSWFLTYLILQVIWVLGIKLIISPLIEKLENYVFKGVQVFGNMIEKANLIKKPSSEKEGSEIPIDPLGRHDLAQIEEEEHEEEEYLEEEILDEVKVDHVNMELKQRQEAHINHIVKTHFANPGHYYKQINEEIDYQVTSLKDYKIGNDFDQGLLDYLELFNLYSINALFGILFPLSFLTCYVIALVEWRLDTEFLILQTRRPSPSNGKTIGQWLKLLGLITILSNIANSFYISFMLFETETFGRKFGIFLLSMFVIFFGNWLYRVILKKANKGSDMILWRWKEVKQKVFAKAKPDTFKDMRIEFTLDTGIMKNIASRGMTKTANKLLDNNALYKKIYEEEKRQGETAHYIWEHKPEYLKQYLKDQQLDINEVKKEPAIGTSRSKVDPKDEIEPIPEDLVGSENWNELDKSKDNSEKSLRKIKPEDLNNHPTRPEVMKSEFPKLTDPSTPKELKNDPILKAEDLNTAYIPVNDHDSRPNVVIKQITNPDLNYPRAGNQPPPN